MACLLVSPAPAAPTSPRAAPTITAEKDIPKYTLFSAPETDLPIRLRPKKPQVVHLNSEVGDVKVDDMPSNVSAIIYGKNSVVLFAHNIGGAHFTVFGKDGSPLMARYVIVSNPGEKYARILLACKNAGDIDCDKTHVYYCPNLCYKTRIVSAVPPNAAISK
jgi:Flp pilus assembly secretin CpaC